MTNNYNHNGQFDYQTYNNNFHVAPSATSATTGGNINQNEVNN